MTSRLSERRFDVVCLGEALVDFYADPPATPIDRADRWRRFAGGAPANVATCVARLGGRVALIGRVGADDFGAYLRRTLADEGVDVDGLGDEPTRATGICFLSVADGVRRFARYPKGAPAADKLLTASDLSDALLSHAAVVYAGSTALSAEPSCSTTLDALARARRLGARVVVDVNLRLHQWAEAKEAVYLAKRLIALADVVKGADDELLPLFGSADVAAGASALRRLGPSVAVVTLGERGAFAELADGTLSVAGEQVDAIDPTGAGDGFVGALCLGLARLGSGPLDRDALRSILVEANHVGALATTAFGATTALPRRPPPS